MSAPKFYTFNEVLEILGISRNTLYKAIANGEIKGNKFCGQWRFSEKSLEAVAAESDVPDSNTSVISIARGHRCKPEPQKQTPQKSLRERLKEAGVCGR
jgi:excisionase family DNA binding protein